MIDADRQASYEKVVQLLDLLQALNIDKVALGSVEQQPGNSPLNLQPNQPIPPAPTNPVIPPSTPPNPGVGVPPAGQPPLTPINPAPSNGTSGR